MSQNSFFFFLSFFLSFFSCTTNPYFTLMWFFLLLRLSLVPSEERKKNSIAFSATIINAYWHLCVWFRLNVRDRMYGNEQFWWATNTFQSTGVSQICSFIADVCARNQIKFFFEIFFSPFISVRVCIMHKFFRHFFCCSKRLSLTYRKITCDLC